MEVVADLSSCSAGSSCSERSFGEKVSVPAELMEEVIETSANIGRGVRRRSSASFQLAGYTEPPAPAKRRCSFKPQKNVSTPAELENFYRKAKYKPPTLKGLETIYEEPIAKKSGPVFLGPVKSRRFIFSGRVTKDKVKKRKIRVKKLKHVPNKKRITMDAFLTRFYAMMGAESDANSPEVLAKLFTSCQLTTSSP